MENTSLMYLFHSTGLILLLLIISVSTADIKMSMMLAKETASLADVRFHIMGLHVLSVSVFGKKSDAVCSFLAYMYICAILWFLDPPYTPLLYSYIF